MSKKTLYKMFAPCFLAGCFIMQPNNLFAKEKKDAKNEEKAAVEKVVVEEAKEEQKTPELSDISEAFGHIIVKNLESFGIEFNMERLLKGIHDSIAGKECPMDERVCLNALSSEQDKKLKALASENLKSAEKFLEDNAKVSGVVSLEENKLQYKIEKAGDGEVVEAHYTPKIRYVGKYIDGKVFGASKGEDDSETISLDETISGFSRGVVGMKEGEKRTLYIHPEFGFGTNGYLAPNALLTFEIEVVKANNVTEESDSDTISSNLSEDVEDEDFSEDEEYTESMQ